MNKHTLIPLVRKDGTVVAHAIVDEDDAWLLKWTWRRSTNGYATRSIADPDRIGQRIVVWMHREVLRCPPELEADHINRDRIDNRKSNLRACTRAENMLNKCVYSNNSSGRTGVFFRADHQKWQGYVNKGGKRKHVGYFNTIEAASEAVENERRLLGFLSPMT